MVVGRGGGVVEDVGMINECITRHTHTCCSSHSFQSLHKAQNMWIAQLVQLIYTKGFKHYFYQDCIYTSVLIRSQKHFFASLTIVLMSILLNIISGLYHQYNKASISMQRVRIKEELEELGMEVIQNHLQVVMISQVCLVTLLVC